MGNFLPTVSLKNDGRLAERRSQQELANAGRILTREINSVARSVGPKESESPEP